MRVVLVAEAWGKTEETMKHPLVGASGRELAMELAHAGLAPFMTQLCRKCKTLTRVEKPSCEHCGQFVWPNEFTLIDHWKSLRHDHGIAVTNVFNTRPPDNDLGFFFGALPETEMTAWKASKKSGGSHLKKEFLFHLKRLWREIEDLHPNLVVAMGNASCWALLDQTKITALRGTVTWSERVKTKVIPTFHPAAVIRPTGWAMRPICIADYRKALRESAFPEIRRPERWINIIDPTPEGIREGHLWSQKPASSYAVDIETWRGLITMVGFARAKDDALVVCFRNENGSSYWPTKDLEFQAWKLVIQLLKTSAPKIFQNGVYDLSYFLRLGIQPTNCLHDTMLWHHSEFLELPKSLGFLGSLYSNEVSWKLMNRHQSAKRDE